MGLPKKPAPAQPDPAAVVAYAELRPRLATGDLVLFGGKSTLCRRIQRLTGSSWSHAALLFCDPGADDVRIWEATSSGDLKDLDTGRTGPGVRLTPFGAWVALYGEQIAVRRLAVERSSERMAALAGFRREMAGRPYEKHRLQLLRSLGAGPLGRNAEPDLSSLFCSELVAAAYQRMGLLRDRPPSNNYTPKDFSSDRRPRLRLLDGATLGPEIFLSR
jgi:hypothetical protein